MSGVQTAVSLPKTHGRRVGGFSFVLGRETAVWTPQIFEIRLRNLNKLREDPWVRWVNGGALGLARRLDISREPWGLPAPRPRHSSCGAFAPQPLPPLYFWGSPAGRPPEGHPGDPYKFLISGLIKKHTNTHILPAGPGRRATSRDCFPIGFGRFFQPSGMRGIFL